MPPRPPPADLLPWALAVLGLADPGGGRALTVVAGDASSRRYFRLEAPGESYILVHAPPATENNTAFLAARGLLEEAGVRVPALHAVDLERGYLVLEDLGDRLLLPELDAATADTHYRHAFALLQRLSRVAPPGSVLPAYDEGLLREELGRCPTWYVERLLGQALPPSARELFDRLSARLVESALGQSRVVVHRDFHSRNLMLQPDGGLAVIDFQDAVIGPFTYDLVSLLRDCYIRWPVARVRGWALAYRDLQVRAGRLKPVADAEFLRWFDWMGLQRHIKVLGTFARLYLRDGKPGYLDDLPLVIEYVREVLVAYAGEEAVFADFLAWFESLPRRPMTGPAGSAGR